MYYGNIIMRKQFRHFRMRCEIMTVKELYFANDGWLSDTKIKVLGTREGVLYDGVFINMPEKIVNSRVVVFNDHTIVIS